MFGGFGIDPLQIGTEVVTLGVFIFVLFALYYKKDAVLFALTGDTHIHADCNDCIWWCFKCGDTCTGDWTRCLTSCSWCPRRVRNVNLVTFIGQTCGFVSKNVEIKNLVVGDLPYRGRGDFFITIECASNPDISTSVMENKEPKTVHFPEVLTIRAKHSAIGGQIRITVKEVRTFGFEELCELHLDAIQVMDWRDEDEMQRFAMKVVAKGLVPETQPWILMQFSHPMEARDVDNMHGTSYIRTINRDGHTQDRTVADFKTSYSLVDATGHAVMETDEEDLSQVHRLRMCLSWAMWIINTLIFFALMTFCLFRFYLWSCWRQFYALTQAKLNNSTFPVSTKQLKDIMKMCEDKVTGTGIDPGNSPCRPSDEEVKQVCHGPPPGQEWPGAGRMLVEHYFNVRFHGLKCYSPPSAAYMKTTGIAANTDSSLGNGNDAGNLFAQVLDRDGGVCEVRQAVQPWDNTSFVIAFFLVTYTVCFRFTANQMIRSKKNRMAADSTNLHRSMMTQAKGLQTRGSSRTVM
jgi:hypothetical protein